MVAVATASGETALTLSKYRNFVPTIGVSDSEAVLRRMCLYWGVVPLAGAPTDDADELLDHVTRWGRNIGCLDSGDRIVLVAGGGMEVTDYNMIVVHEVEE
jgi:pyruvate kinase